MMIDDRQHMNAAQSRNGQPPNGQPHSADSSNAHSEAANADSGADNSADTNSQVTSRDSGPSAETASRLRTEPAPRRDAAMDKPDAEGPGLTANKEHESESAHQSLPPPDDPQHREEMNEAGLQGGDRGAAEQDSPRARAVARMRALEQLKKSRPDDND